MNKNNLKDLILIQNRFRYLNSHLKSLNKQHRTLKKCLSMMSENLLFLNDKKFFDNWEKICRKKKMTKYEVCLKYALSNNYIDKVIVGIDSAQQFKKLIISAGYIDVPKKSIDASNEINLINPAKW